MRCSLLKEIKFETPIIKVLSDDLIKFVAKERDKSLLKKKRTVKGKICILTGMLHLNLALMVC